MITYLLVALLIGLLIVDFSSYLRSSAVAPTRAPWTIPDPLLIISTIMATFCIGLAWRYYIAARPSGTQSPEISAPGDWLPYVLVLLALCIIIGFIQTWQGPKASAKPIRDPYYLLESSLHRMEPAPVPVEKRKWFIARGLMLTFSILIGFVGAAALLQVGFDNPQSSIFANQRVRPTPQPIPASAFEIVEQPLAEIVINEDMGSTTIAAVSEPAQAANQLAQAPSVEDDRAESGNGDDVAPAIGGPVGETTIEAIAGVGQNATSQNAIVENATDALARPYSVVIQATLGVKARTLPGTEGDVIIVLGYGYSYPAIGRTSDGEWIQVQLNEESTAWIITEAVDGLLFDPVFKIVALDELPSVTVRP